MNLSVISTTLHEYVNGSSQFTELIRQSICQSVEQISIEDMEILSSKHESDPDNFDGRIESNLRNILTNSSIKSNHRISDTTKFNSDIIIQAGNNYICLEIEKGYMSRFEFDVFKMQTCASNIQKDNPNVKVYGAFIVPSDNVVASHISGNARESSYKYLMRFSRLVAEIRPPILEDILIVGYSSSEVIAEDRKYEKTPKIKSPGSDVSYVIDGEGGLVDNETIKYKLQGYPIDLAIQLRDRLVSELPGLREKLNFNSKYLGYANENRSDALYVYIQKKQLVLDVRVSKDDAEKLRIQGFKVNPRNNYQCRTGWLTGLAVPHDTNKLDVIVELALMALRG